MALYEHLPIYKKALDVAVHFAKMVAGFCRYHKYTLCSELRNQSRAVVSAVVRANSEAGKLPALLGLRPVNDGVDFLGYIVCRDYLLVRRRVVNNLKRKLKGFEAELVSNGPRVRRCLPPAAARRASQQYRHYRQQFPEAVVLL